MTRPNQMDTRNRSAFDIVAELRAMKKPCLLAVLGTHNVDASVLRSAVAAQWSRISGMFGFRPARLMTGCAGVGTEKATRLVAKSVTGELAVVFHRAEVTYGKKVAEEMRDLLLAQEADALLLVTTGKKVCQHARERFGSRGKRVFEIEVG
jgi:hypothetical protein